MIEEQLIKRSEDHKNLCDVASAGVQLLISEAFSVGINKAIFWFLNTDLCSSLVNFMFSVHV